MEPSETTTKTHLSPDIKVGTVCLYKTVQNSLNFFHVNLLVISVAKYWY